MIRPGTPADAEGVARVHVRSWQEAYAHVFPAEELAGLSAERRARAWREDPPIVAELDGQIIGFVSVGDSRDEDADGELYAIYVDPLRWGSGNGRALIRAGEERLQVLGYREAVLWVLEDNPQARGFYEAAGWTLDGKRRTIAPFGVSVWEVRYRKRL